MRSYRHWIAVIMAVVMLGMAGMIACTSPWPDYGAMLEDVDGMLASANDPNFAGYEAPEQVDEEHADLHNNIDVVIAADVVVPDAPGFHVINIGQHGYDWEDFAAFVDNTAGDTTFYYYQHDFDGEFDIYYPEEGVYITEGRYKSPFLSEADTDAVMAAFDALPSGQYDGVVDHYRYIYGLRAEGEPRERVEYNSEARPALQTRMFYSQDYSERVHFWHERGAMSYMSGLLSSSRVELADTFATDDLGREGASVDELSVQAAAAVEALGSEHGFTLTQTGTWAMPTAESFVAEHLFGNNGEAIIDSGAAENTRFAEYGTQPLCRALIYSPTFNGVPVLFATNLITTTEEIVSATMSPHVAVMIDESGLHAIRANNTDIIFYGINEKNPKLLPFDTIIETFRINLPDKLNTVNPIERNNATGTYYDKTITINRIELGYGYGRRSHNTVLTPVWMFYGIETETDRYTNTPIGHCFMCIDAITGEIVEFEDMYELADH